MDSQRRPLRTNFHVYQGQFLFIDAKQKNNFLLPKCLKKSILMKKVYVLLKVGTLFFYESKRSYLNNPQQPLYFYNLNTTNFELKSPKKEEKFILIKGMFEPYIKLYGNYEEELLKLNEGITFNCKNLDGKLLFPNRFSEMEMRLKEKKQFNISWHN